MVSLKRRRGKAQPCHSLPAVNEKVRENGIKSTYMADLTGDFPELCRALAADNKNNFCHNPWH